MPSASASCAEALALRVYRRNPFKGGRRVLELSTKPSPAPSHGLSHATHPHTQVEGILAGVLRHVLVGRNAPRLERLRRKLLLLPTAHNGNGTLMLAQHADHSCSIPAAPTASAAKAAASLQTELP